MIITQFAGIQNTSDPRDIPDNALQDAVNVDITNGGGIVARVGSSLAKTLAVDTAYTTFDGATFVVSSGALYRINSDLSLSGLGSSTATEFADYQQYLFTNDGYQVFGESVVNLNVPVPSQPSVVITGGSKPAGRYSVLTTYTNASGLEGGTSLVTTVELTVPGDILVTTATGCNVYITEADGQVFFNQATGLRLLPAQINAGSFPANADKIEYHESRLYVTERMGDYTVVWFSDPLLFHLYGQDDGYFIVPGQVQAMKSTPGGLVIGSDKEIYVYQDGSLQRLAAYGVVPGRPMVRQPDGKLLIHTVRGVCSALPFTPITEAKVSLPMGEVCATALMNAGGIQRYIAMHDGAGEAFNTF